MFYFFYKINIFRLNIEKDDIRCAYAYFNFIHETVNSHNLEKEPAILLTSFSCFISLVDQSKRTYYPNYFIIGVGFWQDWHSVSYWLTLENGASTFKIIIINSSEIIYIRWVTVKRTIIFAFADVPEQPDNRTYQCMNERYVILPGDKNGINIYLNLNALWKIKMVM